MAPRKKELAASTSTSASGLSAEVLKARAARSAMAQAAIKKATGAVTIQASYSAMTCVPSGSINVNYLIGGSPAGDGSGPICPGFPRRKIVEVFGHESCGKTTAALAAIVQCQKAGGVALFLDFEHSLNHTYARNVGVDMHPDALIYLQPDTLEDGMRQAALAIGSGIDLVVVDSVASMVPRAELAKKPDENAKIGAQAKAMSELLPKFCIWLAKQNPGGPGTCLMLLNQTRAKISTGGYGGKGGGDSENTSGGNAIKFYSSVRLSYTRIKSETVKRKDHLTGEEKNIQYGNVVVVKCVKNKVAPHQNWQTKIFIRYGYGLDDYLSVIESGVHFKIFKKNGSSYVYGDQQFKGRDALRKYLMSNPEAFAKVSSLLASKIGDLPTEESTDEDEIESTDDLMSEINASFGDVEGEDYTVDSGVEEEIDSTEVDDE